MAPKLLIVDDDAAIADGLALYGRERGYEVLTAYAGDTALELAQSHRPDVILLDVMLPGMDGCDMMVRLKQLGLTEDAVVIFLTAREAQADRILGLELGAADYITKPVSLSHLYNKIARLLEKKAAGEL